MAAAPSSCVLRPGPIANCQVYSANNACLVCAAGFKFSPVSGSCDAFTGTIANCQLYQSDGTCYRCQAGALLAPAGVCIVNCEKAVQGICSLCIPRFYPTGGACVAVAPAFLPNCQYFTEGQGCLYC